MDRKQASRRAKGDPKNAKNAYQGHPESLGLVRGTYSRRPWASPKDQRSLKKAAMLATNCKLQTGDWILDAEALTRRGYGEFLKRDLLPTFFQALSSGMIFWLLDFVSDEINSW